MESSPTDQSPDIADVMVVADQLDRIKNTKLLTGKLSDIKNSLRDEIEVAESENRHLQEYKNEFELLLQERNAHSEEMRLINTDINLLETTMKQSKEDRATSIMKAKRFYAEYLYLRSQINQLRASLGLESLNDNNSDDNLGNLDSYLSTVGLDDCVLPNSNPSYDWSHLESHLSANDRVAGNRISSTDIDLEASRNSADSSMEAMSALRSSNMGSSSRPSNPVPSGFRPNPPFGSSSTSMIGPDHSSIRQQPPPMKSCLSCHQQIHRNAPICPLCKAKSRSRNPKKPKRKPEF